MLPVPTLQFPSRVFANLGSLADGHADGYKIGFLADLDLSEFVFAAPRVPCSERAPHSPCIDANDGARLPLLANTYLGTIFFKKYT